MTKPDGLTTIIVSCCGQLEYTRLCVMSLLRHTRMPFELVFLDSDSLDGTKDFLDGVMLAARIPVDVLQIPTEPTGGKQGVGREGLLQVRGDFLILLNNDVVVTEGWVESLTRTAAADATVGMAVPMSNTSSESFLVDPIPYSLEDIPDMRLSRPSLVTAIETVNRFAKEWGEKHRGQIVDGDFYSGGCALLKKDVLQKIGLFPTRTSLGSFDLEKLSLRLRDIGHRVRGAKDVYVHFFGSRYKPA